MHRKLIKLLYSLTIAVSNFEVQTDSVSTSDNKCGSDKHVDVVQSNEQDRTGCKKFCETSSDNLFVKAKPSSGVFKKINILLTRMFASKL